LVGAAGECCGIAEPQRGHGQAEGTQPAGARAAAPSGRAAAGPCPHAHQCRRTGRP
jgi:hypothetical protein